MFERTIEITLSGKSDHDLDLAFDETARLIREGYLSGGNSNDDGSFNFSVKNI